MTELRSGDPFGAYAVEHVLGRGGGATVYRVRHRTLGTSFALKVPRGRGRHLRERLLQEGRAQAHLDHPNVVGVRDVAYEGDDVGLVMDLVDGVPLDRVAEAGPLTEDQVDALAEQLFDAVEAAHRLGLVHRDLKLENVLVDVQGDQLRVRVTDFGLVKALAEGMKVARTTTEGTMMGTPAFMAPEQFRDASSVDARADLYSLGCVLYALAASATPFPLDSDVREQLQRTLQGSWMPLDVARPDAPTRWVTAVHACLELQASDRPASVQALRELWAAPPRDHVVHWPAGMLRALRRGRALGLADRRTVLRAASAPTRVLPSMGTLSHGTEAVHLASPPRTAGWLVVAGGVVGLGLAASGALLGLLVWIAALFGAG